MRFLQLSKKSLTVLICLSSFGILAKVIHDYQFNSPEFLNDKEIVSVKSFDSYERQVASNQEKRGFRVIKSIDSKQVDGNWEIKRIVFPNEDKDNLNIPVELKWRGNGIVQAYKNGKLVLDNLLLSFISERGTIALVNVIKGESGAQREIIEAKRVFNYERSERQVVLNEKTESSHIRGVQVEEDHLELTLESVYHPQKSKQLLVGGAISGEVVVYDGNIDSLYVSVAGDSFEIVSAKIEAGGVFTSELSSGQEISGRFAADGGKGRYQIRLFKEPYKDMVLKFVSREVFESENEKRLEQEIVETVTERGEVMVGRATASEAKVISKEEMGVIAQKYGFNFKKR